MKTVRYGAAGIGSSGNWDVSVDEDLDTGKRELVNLIMALQQAKDDL